MKIYCFDNDEIKYIDPNIGFMGYVISRYCKDNSSKTFMGVDNNAIYFTFYEGKSKYFIEYKKNNCAIFSFVSQCIDTGITKCMYLATVNRTTSNLMNPYLDYAKVKSNALELAKYLSDFTRIINSRSE